MLGTRLLRGSFLSRFVNSYPSIPGMFRSVTTASGVESNARSSACRPLCASATRKPASTSHVANNRRPSRSSSTSSTSGPNPGKVIRRLPGPVYLWIRQPPATAELKGDRAPGWRRLRTGGPAPPDGVRRSSDVSGDEPGRAGPRVPELQRGGLSENEQRQRVFVEPRVIADRLHVLEHDARVAAVDCELPEALRPIGFHTDDAHLSGGRHSRRVLALGRVRDLHHASARDVVSIDVG